MTSQATLFCLLSFSETLPSRTISTSKRQSKHTQESQAASRYDTAFALVPAEQYYFVLSRVLQLNLLPVSISFSPVSLERKLLALFYIICRPALSF